MTPSWASVRPAESNPGVATTAPRNWTNSHLHCCPGRNTGASVDWSGADARHPVPGIGVPHGAVAPGGRIDTLGLDENGSPVVIEYKKGSDSGVLSEAVSYLSWLDSAHRQFGALVRKTIGTAADGLHRGRLLSPRPRRRTATARADRPGPLSRLRGRPAEPAAVDSSPGGRSKPPESRGTVACRPLSSRHCPGSHSGASRTWPESQSAAQREPSPLVHQLAADNGSCRHLAFSVFLTHAVECGLLRR